MLRITETMADYLLATRRGAQIPGLVKDELKPFVQRNTHTIGFISPAFVSESDSRFLVELSIPPVESMEEAEQIAEDPSKRSWWLFKREELQAPTEPFEVKRHLIDKYFSDEETMINISDCALVIPTEESRATTSMVDSLEFLFQMFPDLKDCLDPEKERLYGNHSHPHP